jgi:helicase
MKVTDLKGKLPDDIIEVITSEGIEELRPSQEKAINAGLLDFESVLICTPTASGKTLIAEMAGGKSIVENRGKVIYIVPLIALATEKFKEFKRKYEKLFKVTVSHGDLDSGDKYLENYDLKLRFHSLHCRKAGFFDSSRNSLAKTSQNGNHR